MNSDIRNKSSSIAYALRALLLFRDRDLVRVSELADELGVARSTAHRVLNTLQAHGFALQARHRGGYRPGPRLMEIGFAALRGLDVRRVARPHLEALSRQLGETVHLLALEGSQCRFLDSVESMATVRVS
ncbi:MAG: IclR family transcriptional regulator, partial [Candidatus Dormibacteria bacterium]